MCLLRMSLSSYISCIICFGEDEMRGTDFKLMQLQKSGH